MEGAAQSLASKVGQLVAGEFQKLRGVGGEVARLRDELATMNALLRMQSEAAEGAVDHFVREWMKQLREVAYDAEDSVDLYLFRVRCRPGDHFLVRWKHLVATISSRRRLVRDIRALRAQAAATNEQHARYGVSLEPLRRPPNSSASAPATVVASSSTNTLHRVDDPSQFIGLNKQATFLADKLKSASDTERQVKVFSIVGFGGLGKTTLAMEAFDGRKGVKGLLVRVLQQIVKPKLDNDQGIKEENSVGNMDGVDEDGVADKLADLLHEKRYLIVIDDVWTISAWDAIRPKLPDNNCASRIIVTTRIDTIAQTCSDDASGSIYRIEALNTEDSEKLFLSRTFGSMSASCPNELKDTMEKILKKCGGLPLAIISIASLLACYKSPESKGMWNTVLKSIGSQMQCNPTLKGMRQIVTLSYDHLPHHLKGCMMYLSIFPEDYVIVKDRLLRRWIAEGLVAEDRGLTLMEVAESYFNELVSRSMIDRAADIANFYDGRVETCRVHDVMLEVLVSKSLESNFVSLIGGQYEGMRYDRIRRLSVHGGGKVAKESPSRKVAAGFGRKNAIMGMNVQHTRSLSMFELDRHKLLDRLGEFTLLRILDLEDCNSLENKHMGYICQMYLLRFLNLKGTDISELPREVGKLVHLQTLDARMTCLKDLPKTVIELEELESLQFSNKSDKDIRWMPPPGVKKMKGLRKVNKVVVQSNKRFAKKVAEEISELEQLLELSIYVDSRDVINQDVHETLIDSVGKLYSLRCLNFGDIGWDLEVMNFLHHLRSPPRLLRYLRICGGLAGFGLPDWVGLLTYLVEFVIAWTLLLEGDPLFEVLCKLPNLKRITMEQNSYRGEKLVVQATQSFPELTDLKVLSAGIPALYQFEKGSMPKLERFEMLMVGSEQIVGIQHLTNLREVQLSGKIGNSALKLALENLKEENGKRSSSNQFKVQVRYE
ncbi:unnamed protein product [Miscanthus lutarioriparius]|uniref:Uncharacterized protein n=1 Tax=Miscanthus lutarioriparius TaxID=422564 RepID=A0A811Q2D9_9POAL|nr:unnamed protein product [Miscanthus lutarioriparius]